jgi:ribonuclease D
MRENSYWPDLCLVQVASPTEAAAIDPKAEDLDLAPLLELLVNNEEVLKVFHAGGQDIEIIFNLTGGRPTRCSTPRSRRWRWGWASRSGTRIWSRACSASISTRARALPTGRAARWTRGRSTMRSATSPTLATLFPRMLERLRETGRGAWLDQEMERLADPANYLNDPGEAWKRVKIASRKADVLGRLKVLAAWREIEARSKNLPRGRIMKDETLADVALHPPTNQEALGRVRGLSPAWRANDIGGRMMDALSGAPPMDADEMPSREDRGPALGKDGALVADLLKLLLKIRAKESNVAARLVARSDELEQLAAGKRTGLSILEGWRFEQFGRDALDLVEGRLAFAVRKGKMVMTRTERE